MVTVENNIKKLSWCFIDLYFIEKDYQQCINFLDKHMTWIDIKGMYIDNVEKILNKQLYLSNQIIERKLYVVKPLSKKTYLVIAFVKINRNDGFCQNQNFLISMIWEKSIEWRIVHVQFSNEDNFDGKNTGENLCVFNKHYQDISEKVKNVELFDTLTQIYNLHGFQSEVHNILSGNRKEQYVIIMFKITNFHFINRKYGYEVGDEVLKNIAKNLTKTLKVNEICGRNENDIFIMLYKMINNNDLEYRLNNIKGKLVDKKLLKKLNIDVQLKFGIYVLSNHEEDIRNMIDKASIAMQNVKKETKGSQYLYYEDWMLNQQYQDTKALEDASQAMVNEEFVIYIQPQFDIKTKTIVSGEALVRWKLNDGTIRMPSQFIELFEKQGMILSFDFYMLEHLCKMIKEWIDNQKTVMPISINQSRLHIEETNYFQDFCSVIDKYNIPHHLIIFELTESAFVENKEMMMDLANQLHNHGFKLAIDDFGVGYASLNLLSVISADILKLDKTLLDNYDTNPKTKIIMQKIIEMAHQMGMLVVCEGIETEAQLNFVRKINCDIGQGFLISKPIEAKKYSQQWINRD